MSIESLRRRLERLRRAKTVDVENSITRIVLVPLRREGEPERAGASREVVIWEAKETNHHER